MSTNKMSAFTRDMPPRYAMPGFHDGGRSEGDTMRFTTRNPFDALDTAAAHSDGSGSSNSPTSSGNSTSQIGYSDSGVSLTPSREHVGPSLSASQQRGTYDGSPEQLRHMSINSGNMASTIASPSRLQNGPGSPELTMTPRRFGNANGHQTTVTTQDSPQTPRRDSVASQASPSSRKGSGRVSFSSSLRAPTMLTDPNASSLTGVPETLAVQEMAFRQGQHDNGLPRDRVPPNPFDQQYDQVWAQYYKLGKEVGGTPPVKSSTAATSSGHQNFPWPVLINPYTQNLERPNGAVDPQWVRNVCEMALNCMEALVRMVCKRHGDWRKIVCDVPVPMQQALVQFPDLGRRYDSLKRAAREALAGGHPKDHSFR